MLSLEGSGDGSCWADLAWFERVSQKVNLSCACSNCLRSCGVNPWLRVSTSSNFLMRALSSGRSVGAGSWSLRRAFLLRMASSMPSRSIWMSGEAEVMSRRLLRMDCRMPSRSLPVRLVRSRPSSSDRTCCFSLQAFRIESSRIRLLNTDSKMCRFGSGSVRSKIGAIFSQSDSRMTLLPLGLYSVRSAERRVAISSGGYFISQKNSMRWRSGSRDGKAAQLSLHPSDAYSARTSSARSLAISAWVRPADSFLRMNSCNLDLISRVPSLRMAFSRSSSLVLNFFSTRSLLPQSNLFPLLKAMMISSISSGVISSLLLRSRFTRQKMISRAVSSWAGSARSVSSSAFRRQYRSTSQAPFSTSFHRSPDSFRQKWSKNLTWVLSSGAACYTSAALAMSSGRRTFFSQTLPLTQPEQNCSEVEHSRWNHLLQRSHSMESELAAPAPPQGHHRKNSSPLWSAHTKKRSSGTGLGQSSRPLREDGKAGAEAARRWASRLSSCLSSSPTVRKALQVSACCAGRGRATQLRWEQLGQSAMQQDRPGERSWLQFTHRAAFTSFFGGKPSARKTSVRQEASLVLGEASAQSTCIHSSPPTFLSNPFSLSLPQTEQTGRISFPFWCLHSSHLNFTLAFSSKAGLQQLRCTNAEQPAQLSRSCPSPSSIFRWQTSHTISFRSRSRRYFTFSIINISPQAPPNLAFSRREGFYIDAGGEKRARRVERDPWRAEVIGLK